MREGSGEKSYVYLLRCADGTIYCGWTKDLTARLRAHNLGVGAKYTRSRRPVTLAWFEACDSSREARRREWQLKRLSRKEKLMLIKEGTTEGTIADTEIGKQGEAG